MGMKLDALPFNFDLSTVTDQEAIGLYEDMLFSRMIEEKMLSYLRQGKISKWFSGIGQEAIAVGCSRALHPDERIFPMHRNLGVFTTRGIPLSTLYAQWQGKMEGFTQGRDRSFHFGTMDYNIAGMISHLGPQLSVAAGTALAYKLNDDKKVSLAFTGEGGTSQGEFHEALNVAAVWNLPVIFVIENNGYGLSTPTSQQYACDYLYKRAEGYGMKAMRINGNDVLQVYSTVSQLAEEMRHDPHPVLLECETFRQRGHEEASGTKYVPSELMEFWKARDPLIRYEEFLVHRGLLDQTAIETKKQSLKEKISSELNKAESFTAPSPQGNSEVESVYESYAAKPAMVNSGNGREVRFIDAIAEELDSAMETHPELVLMGQDIADYGGVFKITEGLMEKYGADRVRNTPLCESAILGIALGMSLEGKKAMVEMQFADFVSCGFNQIVNNIAKIHYRWGARADVVIRMPTGGGISAGPFHSQSNEAWFFHVPGLRIVYPSTPEDARLLLRTAFDDPNPYLYFEHKALYRSIKGDVTDSTHTDAPGTARVVRSGEMCSIITYGSGVHWAMKIAEEHSESIEVLDLRWLSPLDYESIRATVRKTSKVLVLHEDTLTGGIGAEISAWITEHCFEYLDAPVVRCASLDTPVPFAGELEKEFLPTSRLENKLGELLAY